ncbi:cullin-1-like [Impatiens glandulifera]|uniref:cullin-1-like n=1 Tax=Impatiens glandulifera TaxID=253017 RepID=UPI001FB185D5|nr:cullin-1-like [Impatiens glandulifera]
MAKRRGNGGAITVEEGWTTIQHGINRLIDNIEDIQEPIINTEERMEIYTTAYNICLYDKIYGHECQKLYERYNQVFQDYISSKVMPCLVGKEGDNLLQEIVKRWENHKFMTIWISKFFIYLTRYFIPCGILPTLQESSYSIFYKLILGVHEVMDSLMSMIQRLRIGDPQVNQNLVRSAIDMYMEIGKDYYEKDFEKNILKQTRQFYSHMALDWINDENISYKGYMLKVNEYLMIERLRVAFFLKENTRLKLIKVVNRELLSMYDTESEEKMKSCILN